MMDFDCLHKALEKRKLLGKPLSDFDLYEMRELWLAFLQSCNTQHKSCAKCKHHGWKKEDPDPWCLHPDHQSPMYAFMFHLPCESWRHWKDTPEDK